MKNKIIEILTEIRPEFDFNVDDTEFMSKGMLDSFDIISLIIVSLGITIPIFLNKFNDLDSFTSKFL